MRTERLTDEHTDMTKLMVAFSSFANARINSARFTGNEKRGITNRNTLLHRKTHMRFETVRTHYVGQTTYSH
jgi:hypothetical protein